jgi:hypothetical protein
MNARVNREFATGLLSLSIWILLGVMPLTVGEAVLAIPTCQEISNGMCLNTDECHNGHIVWGSCDGNVAEFWCYWDECPHSATQYCNNCLEGGGGGCFLKGTPITMADGTMKPIEEIVPGDQVLAYDEADGKMKSSVVEAVRPPRTVKQYLIVDETVQLTPSQPVFRNGKWVSAGDLYAGDSVLSASGGMKVLTSIRLVEDNVTVYNSSVRLGTYVAHGLVFHNKTLPYTIAPCPNCPPGP